MRRIHVRSGATLFAAAALAGSIYLPAAEADTTAARCVDKSIPVTVLGQHRAQISGTLCTPAVSSPATIQVLIPGATYNRTYWDFPGRSYARYAAAKGQSTFAIDRLDTGHSSQVPPALLTLSENASSVHQVIGSLRSGVVGRRFTRVIVVAHSYGSMVALSEAATYHDVQGAALTGFTHFPKPSFLALIPVVFTPTQLAKDAPQFSGRPLGELTIEGPARKKYFYAPGDADPAVLAKDIETRDTLSAGEVASFPAYAPQMGSVKAPMLIAVGSEDAVFGCGAVALASCPTAAALRKSEQPYVTGAASFDTYVLPGAGHDLNLSSKYRTWFGELSSWSAKTFART